MRENRINTSHVTCQIIREAEIEEKGQRRQGVVQAAQGIVVHVQVREVGERLQTCDVVIENGGKRGR
jgi:hypothetical protein